MKNRFFSKTLLVLTLFLLFSQFSLSAQDLKQTLPFDSTVTTGTLSNGLRFYIKPNPKPEHKVELRLIVNAGSILENKDQQGLAHFMEHMNFNGTQHYPKNELVDFLQSIGVQFGADLNAYTSFDETVYILPIPTDKPDNLEKGFVVISDWAQKALITDKDVNDERKVVLEESRLGKGADDRMMKVYLPKMMAGSLYAQRLPIGKDNILKNCNPNLIRQFYKDWYRPNLMAVAVVGDVTVEEAKKLIEKYFADLKNPEKPRERKEFAVPAFKKKEALVLTDKEATNQDFRLVYSAKKSKTSLTLGDYREQIVKRLFTQILNNRLSELSQSATPPFLYSYVYIGGWARGYESFNLYSFVTSDLKTAVDASVAELVRAQQYGFTAYELDIAKKSYMSSIEKLYNERNTTESSRIIDEFVRNFLQKETMPGIAKEYQYYLELLPNITLQEINETAKIWLSDNANYFALSTGPQNDKTKKINNGQLLKMVNAALNQQVTPKADKVLATKLLNQEPTAGTITSETADATLGTKTFMLNNGIKVTIKSTDYKSDEILFSGRKKGGTGQFSAQDQINALYFNYAISAMGYGNFTPSDLDDYLSGKYVSVNTSSSSSHSDVDGSSTIKDLETALQLLYLKLTAPRKDPALFTGFVGKQMAALENMKSNPQTAFFDTLTKVIYARNPLAPIIIPTPADFARLNLDRVMEIYANEFSIGDGFEFVFVGNIDENTLKPLLEKYLASLPVKGVRPSSKDNGLRPIKGQHDLKVNIGTEPQSMILVEYYGEMPYSQDLVLKADMIAEILNIKVVEELREKIGGIYSGGLYAEVEKEPYNNFNLTLYLPCGPESVDTLMKAAAIEMNRLKREGPADKDLAKVKLAKIESYREAMKTNGYWLSRLMGIQFSGQDPNRFLHLEEVINAITAEDIKTLAGRLLNEENVFKAVLYPAK